jgi:hypothetical protein
MQGMGAPRLLLQPYTLLVALTKLHADVQSLTT